jgi:hypothetical protein
MKSLTPSIDPQGSAVKALFLLTIAKNPEMILALKWRLKNDGGDVQAVDFSISAVPQASVDHCRLVVSAVITCRRVASPRKERS